MVFLQDINFIVIEAINYLGCRVKSIIYDGESAVCLFFSFFSRDHLFCMCKNRQQQQIDRRASRHWQANNSTGNFFDFDETIDNAQVVPQRYRKAESLSKLPVALRDRGVLEITLERLGGTQSVLAAPTPITVQKPHKSSVSYLFGGTFIIGCGDLPKVRRPRCI